MDVGEGLRNNMDANAAGDRGRGRRGNRGISAAERVAVRVARVKGEVLLGAADDSFESCEGMDDGEPIVVMNPNQFTVEDEVAPEDKIEKSIVTNDTEYVDFQTQQQVNFRIQHHLTIATRDAAHKKRTDDLKAKGLYLAGRDQGGFGHQLNPLNGLRRMSIKKSIKAGLSKLKGSRRDTEA